MQQPNPEHQVAPSKGSKVIKGVRNAIYYGFAIDSIQRSLARTKALSKNSLLGMKGLATSAFRARKFSRARTLDEVIETHNNCAGSMVGTLIVILAYACLAFYSSGGLYAVVVNTAITLAFIFHFIFNLIVYLKCQQVISAHRTASAKADKEIKI